MKAYDLKVTATVRVYAFNRSDAEDSVRDAFADQPGIEIIDEHIERA